MKKRRSWIAFGCLAGFLLLLAALLFAESYAAETPIDSFAKAVWFSFVTLTTVGYGDMVPVTAAGKLIAAVLLLMSLGALAAAVGLAVGYITGTGMPRLRIRRLTDARIYVIDREDSACAALADHIRVDDPDAVLIYPGIENTALFGDRTRIDIRLDTQAVLELIRKAPERVTVIFTGEDAAERFAATRIPDGMRAVCESMLEPEELSDRVRFLDRNRLCASMYWQNYPLGLQDKKVVLVGFGRLGRAVLEQALESCVLTPVRAVAYHVFGDGRDFLGDHWALEGSVCLGDECPDRDSVIFHTEPWTAGAEILRCADRILFVADDCAENVQCYERLKTYCAAAGKVHFYCSGSLNAAYPAFGTVREIFTPENLLRTQTETLARRMHEIYRRENGGEPWEKLSPFLRRSNMAAAAHVAEKLRYLLDDDRLNAFSEEQIREACRRFRSRREAGDDICRRIEHDRWVRFHAMYNWQYAAERDNMKRKHPAMVPFEMLSAKDREKDDYSYLVIEDLMKEG